MLADMDQVVAFLARYSIAPRDGLIAAAVLAAMAFFWFIFAVARRRRARAEALAHQSETDARLDEIARAGAELGGRMQSLAEV